MGLTFAVWAIGVLTGVISTLGIAMRWNQQGKKHRLIAAHLIQTADGLRRKAHREFEDARKLKMQAAQLLRESYSEVELSDVQRFKIMRGGLQAR